MKFRLRQLKPTEYVIQEYRRITGDRHCGWVQFDTIIALSDKEAKKKFHRIINAIEMERNFQPRTIDEVEI